MNIKIKRAIKIYGLPIRILLVFFILVFNTRSVIFSEEQIIGKHKPEPAPAFWQQIIEQNRTLSAGYPEGYLIKLKNGNSLKKALQSGEDNPFKIMGPGKTKLSDLARFIEKHNPDLSPKQARTIARLYIKEAKDEGVNYDVAFSQMCLETGYLKFGGNVLPAQHNLCGLGVTGKGKKGLAFPSLELGIRAHIQHLKAYASNDKLKHKVVDARFKYVKRGSVRDIRNLTGKWASDPEYGKKIENLLKRLMAEAGKKLPAGS